ncbi:hypothetical protein ACMFMG_005688 [Clarireedia jacksonii]
MSCSCCFPAEVEEKEIFLPPSLLARRCHLDHFLRTRFAMSPNSSSSPTGSSLLNLPLECFHNIIQYLDITSLMTVRRTSQDCRAAVDRLLPWKDLVQHAPQALRAVIALEIATTTLLLQLHTALTTASCFYCDDEFAGYLSLFECKRVCAYCIRNESTLRPIELRVLINLKSQRNSNLAPLGSLRRLKTIPGRYGPYKTRMHRRDIIVLASSVRSLPGKSFSDREHDLINGRASSALIPQDPYSDGFELYGHALAPVHDFVNPETPIDVAYRYMSAVEIPFVNPVTKKAHIGLRCKECHLRLLFLTHRWARGVLNGLANDERRKKLADDLKQATMLRYRSEQDLAAHQEKSFSIETLELKYDVWKKRMHVQVF